MFAIRSDPILVFRLPRIGNFPEGMDVVVEDIQRLGKSANDLKSHACLSRVALCANNFVARVGLTTILQGDPDLEVTCATSTEEITTDFAVCARADLLVLEEPAEVEERSLDTLQMLTSKYPALRVLILSQHTDSIYAERAFRAGAWASYPKSGDKAGLLAAIKCVLSRSLRSDYSDSDLRRLSDRELQVLSWISAGHGITQIARQLGISRKTVETHCEHLKLKLDYGSARELKQGARRLLGGP